MAVRGPRPPLHALPDAHQRLGRRAGVLSGGVKATVAGSGSELGLQKVSMRPALKPKVKGTGAIDMIGFFPACTSCTCLQVEVRRLRSCHMGLALVDLTHTL